MANIFLDTNYFVGFIHKIADVEKINLDGQTLFVSPLSFHIFAYINKSSIPDKKLTVILEDFEIIDLRKTILTNALEGPTRDLEDNIQLHSAIEVNADYFLTFDKQLLNMKFFGKTKIQSTV